jgi:putative membrane protein
MRFAVRLLISAAALWAATRLVPGVTYTGGWVPFLGVALVFGVVNAFVRPVAWVLTFPVVILTLGLFLLVINGCMLWLTSALSDALGLGFRVEGFWAAFWGALVVSIVSGMLSLMLRADRQVTRRTIDVRAR